MRFSQPVAFVDLETSGANFARDRITEIGIVTLDPDGRSTEWTTLVNPGVALTPFITGLTGIDDAMVATAPAFAEIAAAVRDLLADRLFIAHNARFDQTFLRAEFRRLGIDFRPEVLCTVKLSRRLYPEHHRHNLDMLIERHGIRAETRHRALADARILYDLWHCWQQERDAETFTAAIRAASRYPALPAHLDPALIADLPESAGAFVLFGEDDALLRSGRASNLRQQLCTLLDPQGKYAELGSRTRRVDWREACGEFGAHLRELELLEGIDTSPVQAMSWKLQAGGESGWTLTLVDSAELVTADAADLFGLYASRREAVRALRKLAEGHRLCPVLLGLESVPAGTPCSLLRNHQCRGGCIGREDTGRHAARLMAALGKLRLRSWPYPGPLVLSERAADGTAEAHHVFDRWCHLGSVSDSEMVEGCIENEKIFKSACYKLLLKFIGNKKLQHRALQATWQPAESPVH